MVNMIAFVLTLHIFYFCVLCYWYCLKWIQMLSFHSNVYLLQWNKNKKRTKCFMITNRRLEVYFYVQYFYWPFTQKNSWRQNPKSALVNHNSDKHTWLIWADEAALWINNLSIIYKQILLIAMAKTFCAKDLVNIFSDF